MLAAATPRRRSHSSPRPRAPKSARPSKPGRASFIAFFAAICVVLAYWAWLQSSSNQVQVSRFEVVNEFPHDAEAYCQGLVMDGGQLYEGTGQYGRSSLRRVTLETGEVLNKRLLDRRLFGEGITIWQDKIFQLTWKERLAIVYDKQTMQPTGQTFRYQGEGWGLTNDGKSLIMSDGTSVLRFLDPKTFRVTRRITVQQGRRRVRNLNELEYVDGEIFANIWQKDEIVRISPRNGAILGRIDLSALRERLTSDGEALNGIAYDAENNRLFVTGKNWPTLFEIRLLD